MAYKAISKIGTKNFPTKAVSVSATRSFDPLTFRPNGKVRAGLIIMTILSSDDSFLWEWVQDATNKQNGKISFYNPQNDTVMKTVEFKAGYCVNYEEIFIEGNTESPQYIKLQIVAKSITVSEATIKNQWEEGASS